MTLHRRVALALCLGAAALGCGDGPRENQAEAAASQAHAELENGPRDVAVIDMGELGEIRFELLPEFAPLWTAYFAERAQAGLYDGTSFHRVIPGFMIQGGGPASLDADPRNDANDLPDADAPPHEFSDYPQERGTVAMANRGERRPGSVMFFIVQEDSPHLTGGYTVIGRVVEGMEVVDAITELEIDKYGRFGPRDRPYPIEARIRKLRIEVPATPLANAATRP